MFHPAYWLDQIPMGSPVKIENLSDGRAPSVVEHVCLLSMQIPKHRTIRVTIEDSVDIRFGTATCVGKFLNKLITVLNYASAPP